MPLYRRIARRGFSNYPCKSEAVPLNVGQLNASDSAGDIVDLESLKAKGLVAVREGFVKILGNGDLGLKLTVKGLAVSAGAKAKIEQAGGTVEEIEG